MEVCKISVKTSVKELVWRVWKLVWGVCKIIVKMKCEKLVKTSVFLFCFDPTTRTTTTTYLLIGSLHKLAINKTYWQIFPDKFSTPRRLLCFGLLMPLLVQWSEYAMVVEKVFPCFISFLSSPSTAIDFPLFWFRQLSLRLRHYKTPNSAGA